MATFKALLRGINCAMNMDCFLMLLAQQNTQNFVTYIRRKSLAVLQLTDRQAGAGASKFRWLSVQSAQDGFSKGLVLAKATTSPQLLHPPLALRTSRHSFQEQVICSQMSELRSVSEAVEAVWGTNLCRARSLIDFRYSKGLQL
ncbi:hypothetical protein CEXT_497741 [Caerostris extrusa]|uniref:Uncharacterized protein n=1 Tax=Caerostris extrusa TaxID=172846 RepID=A0AAV4XU47_CAEEX|nr:hypothetical protein CEXT_497741 [Caerostris extrusa]